MDEIEIVCPACNDPLYIPAEEYDELVEGDVMECENCGAALEFLSLEPLEVVVVEGGEDAFFVDCPRCGTPIEVEEEGEPVTCPECGYAFTPDWSEVEEEEEA